MVFFNFLAQCVTHWSQFVKKYYIRSNMIINWNSSDSTLIDESSYVVLEKRRKKKTKNQRRILRFFFSPMLKLVLGSEGMSRVKKRCISFYVWMTPL